MLSSGPVTARFLAHLTLCTALMALLPSMDAGAETEVDDCCASERASEPDDHDEGHSSECPPGCDEGCACCASVSALPTAPAVVVAVTAAVVFDARRTGYGRHVERAPLAPEPRDRDAVPRAGLLL